MQDDEWQTDVDQNVEWRTDNYQTDKKKEWQTDKSRESEVVKSWGLISGVDDWSRSLAFVL